MHSICRCTVQGSVLCSHVRLEDKVILRDCIVGARVIVHKEGKYKTGRGILWSVTMTTWLFRGQS